MSRSIERAQTIVSGQESLPDDPRPLVQQLKAEQEFGWARKILERVLERDSADVWAVQQLANCTCKDDEMVPAVRFRRALELLERIGLSEPGLTDAETLGLGGAIYKRRWEHGGQLEDLHTAFALYDAAWQRGIDEACRLYGAVNAAFVSDLLAQRSRLIAHVSGTAPTNAKEHAERARTLRQHALPLAQAQIARAVKQVADDEAAGVAAERMRQRVEELYWDWATLAELLFGLGDWQAAGDALGECALLLPQDAWQVHSTGHQLMTLARALETVDPPPAENVDRQQWPAAWKAIARLFGPHARFAVGAYRGKVGLALSGGGFRASLYHIGVLARLGEMDVLRSVEALSTVSGGSIVGAHYYLEVQRLLEAHADADITRADFIDAVRRVQKAFCEGVADNMRMRTLTNLGANLKMAFSHEYTRSNRLGELYERHFYAKVEDRHRGAAREMRQLLVEPAGEIKPFKPRQHNWRRRCKVPVLLLNATSLNSGHNWQFTGRWMGEPPETMDGGIDMNERYRRLWYEQAPNDRLRRWRLGDAVAASACVPGLFEPLVLPDLYPGRTVRLVDGGVHDNQGIEGLLAEGCTLVLASDASGQMDDAAEPPDNRLGVPLRANSILMDRVREAQYQDLRARVDSRSLQGLFFVHLKQGLDVASLDWNGCQDPTNAGAPQSCTGHGLDKALQRQLAAMRTDLDSFSETECEALMLAGYLMADHQFQQLQSEHERSGEGGTWGGFDVRAARGDWSFLRLGEVAKLPPDGADPRREELGRHIGLGAVLFFRVWKLSPVLRAVSTGMSALAALLLLAWLWRHGSDPIVLSWAPGKVWQVALLLVLLVGGVLFPVLNWVRPQQAMRGVATKLALAFVGWVMGWLHVTVFDRLFLALGKVERVLGRRG